MRIQSGLIRRSHQASMKALIMAATAAVMRNSLVPIDRHGEDRRWQSENRKRNPRRFHSPEVATKAIAHVLMEEERELFVIPRLLDEVLDARIVDMVGCLGILGLLFRTGHPDARHNGGELRVVS